MSRFARGQKTLLGVVACKCGIVSAEKKFFTFSPKDIKNAVTGDLCATKKEIENSLVSKYNLNVNEFIKVDKNDIQHLTDAAAIAITTALEYKKLQSYLN